MLGVLRHHKGVWNPGEAAQPQLNTQPESPAGSGWRPPQGQGRLHLRQGHQDRRRINMGLQEVL